MELIPLPIATARYNILLEILCFLASIFQIQNEINEALSLYHRCLTIAVKTNQFSFLPQILMNMGIMLQKARRYQTALNSMMRALEFCYYLDDKMYEINIYDSLGMLFMKGMNNKKLFIIITERLKGSWSLVIRLKEELGIQAPRSLLNLKGNL